MLTAAAARWVAVADAPRARADVRGLNAYIAAHPDKGCRYAARCVGCPLPDCALTEHQAQQDRGWR